MILRPVISRGYISLPNAILADNRLSIETRGMIAYILSKPTTWQIRQAPLAKALSKTGGPLGRTKLGRMFKEATAAGYMSRSDEQAHKENGDFDGFVYVIGLPEDVTAAVADLAQARFAQMHGAQMHGAQMQNEHRIEKERSLEKQNYKKRREVITSHRPAPLPTAEAPKVAEDGYTALGRSAFANGMKFVFEQSEPFAEWLKLRGERGMPLIDVVVIDGKRRRGCWFPSLYPPAHRVARVSQRSWEPPRGSREDICAAGSVSQRVHAELHRPSMMTRSPDCRTSSTRCWY